MKITFLGTGTSQGIPVIGCKCEVCKSRDSRDSRLRTSAIIDQGETTILIDIGPDFRQQMLNNKIESIDAILLTHEHNDHVIGIDDIRPFNFSQHKPMTFYGLHRVNNEVKKRFPYVFSEKPYPGAPQVNLIDIKTEPFRIGDIDILPIPIKHGNLPILAYRLNDFAYITDASYIGDESLQKLRNLDLLVINALRRTPHHSHFTLQEAIDMAQKIGAKKTYLTHISHLLGLSEDLKKELPEGISLAFDELTIEM